MSQKKLGFGLMRLPSLDPNDASKIDIEQTKKMVDTFIEKGFTYFDTAWMYCGFASENAPKKHLYHVTEEMLIHLQQNYIQVLLKQK